jgi:hypothetical protein
VRAMVDRIFSRPYGAGADQKWPASSEFPLRADIKIGDLESFYGITIGEEKGLSLEEWLTRQIEPDLLAADQFVDRAMLRLRIMEMNSQGKIVLVGMSFISPENISLNEPAHGS